ncbi:nitroreductase/quinone reductase family protein [Baekduia sp.]|uniref:nitroreductase/quinone reductase family protein n=1 Tax=Baekduia sp. TaxID=2600305 RepID=UPI002E06D501|nr:nitroreductase/quinone reductase family protein [Baekduia sp.]
MPIPEVDPTAPASLAKRIITPPARTRAGRWTLMNISRRIDPAIVRVSRGRLSTLVFTPAVLLTTVGAKTGAQRTATLVYFTDAGRVILMASNFGQSHHPAWYYNVKANPEVTLYAGGYEGRFRGEEATGAEHDRLWALAKRFSVGYADYEQRSEGRQIPVLAFSLVERPGR